MLKTLCGALAALAVAPQALAADRDAVVATYAEIVDASYRDSLAGAHALSAAVDAFLREPSELSLAAARQAWLIARESYGQTEVYRFYDGPIDDEDGPEGLLNAWPLDEGYIDYTDGGHDHSIIATASVAITPAMLTELNEKDGDANISTGYHAIEFLLWGQDLSDEGPGSRPFTDYTAHPHAERRSQYLRTVADLLMADLSSVAAEWQADGGEYRVGFVADADAALGKMIAGMGSLCGGELAGERMAVALENKDQEDEHSCFSDNTHRDMILNLKGIINVWRGEYRPVGGTPVSGPGLHALVAEADAELAATIDAAFDEAWARVHAVPVPFDQALIEEPGRELMQAAIEQLWVVTRMMPQIASAIGVETAIEGL